MFQRIKLRLRGRGRGFQDVPEIRKKSLTVPKAIPKKLVPTALAVVAKRLEPPHIFEEDNSK
jgi:hypothetical protein